MSFQGEIRGKLRGNLECGSAQPSLSAVIFIGKGKGVYGKNGNQVNHLFFVISFNFNANPNYSKGEQVLYRFPCEKGPRNSDTLHSNSFYALPGQAYEKKGDKIYSKKFFNCLRDKTVNISILFLFSICDRIYSHLRKCTQLKVLHLFLILRILTQFYSNHPK